MIMTAREHTISLVSGATAGLSVDLSLYPIDTIKTRLQSATGFLASGGFRGIYSGISAIAVGSAPGAAVFFLTYESVIRTFQDLKDIPAPVGHMCAASLGEIVACLVRVPCEVIKQRSQANTSLSPKRVAMAALRQEKIWGLYRGYFSTVMREIPFSAVQFPLWEFLKSSAIKRQGRPLELHESSVCGFLAGGLSAAVTTPLDVAKTRIMLAESGSRLAKNSITFALRSVYRQAGIKGLFAGVVPRVTLISFGGAIFLGIYDQASRSLNTRNFCVALQ